MKKKTLALLLSIVMILGMILPSTAAMAEGEVDWITKNYTKVAPLVKTKTTAPSRARVMALAEGDEEDGDADSPVVTTGMVIDKTAKAVEDGFEITLEAYATGDKIIQGTPAKPKDIVLVLDQSGSMKADMSTTGYTAYTGNNRKNSNLYSNRNNLYYKDGDAYYKATVTRATGAVTESYNVVNASSALGYSDNNDNLYAKVNGEYLKVTVTRSGSFGSGKYTFTLPDGTKIAENVNWYDAPTFTGIEGNDLYEKSTVTTYAYTYTYTKDGKTVTLGTSEGADTQFTTATLYYQTTGSSISKLEALKNAANSFVDEVQKDATANNVDHRIAVVGFASDSRSNSYKNTELFIGSTQYNYNVNASSYYGSALQNVNTTTNTTGYENVMASIGELDADGGTAIDLGTKMANNIFDAYKNEAGNADREKVVIIFTDGAPGIFSGDDYSTGDSNDQRTGYADRAITNTYTSKNTYKATVYTVGIFDGADASKPGTLTSSNTWYSNDTHGGTFNNAVANKFMHLLSSNYPKAASMDSHGTMATLTDGKSYYLSAGDSSSLNTIFANIAGEIETDTTQTTLSEETVIRDIIAPQFTLPEGATITLETYKYGGKDTAGKDIWTKNADAMGAQAVRSGDTVSVTGFDFAENHVGTKNDNGTISYIGHKLVIKFTVQVKDGFLGGNDVYTNTSAGIYANSNAETPVMTFPRPTVNVPIKDITITAPDYDIYLKDVPTSDELKGGVTIKSGDVVITDPSKLADWQKEYVDINNSFTTPTGYDGTADSTYTVTASIAPKTNGSTTTEGTTATTKSNTASGKINVYKPVLTYKDSTVWYGGSAPADYTGNLVSEVWMHGTTAANTTTMGAAPTLSKSYTPNASQIADGKINTKADIPVGVTVTMNGTDIAAHTTFKHQDCSTTSEDLKGGKFLLHVKTCSLTITKVNGEAGVPHVFTVKKDGVAYTQATIVGSGSVTIKELPLGTYSIVEDTGWSWRYDETPTYSNPVTLTQTAPTGTLTCTNTKDNDNWFNKFSTVVENIFGVTKVPVANQ